MSDRTPHTDALDTLGSIIGVDEQRDAIHLAVENGVAGHRLKAGDHVGFLPDGTFGKCNDPVGIVDPFLKTPVKQGQHFWLVVYPREITSLRHVWSHPKFPETPNSESPLVEKSRLWIEKFALSINQSYDSLMAAAQLWVRRGDFTYDNSESYKRHWDRFDEFWIHYEIVTNTLIDEEDRNSFFTCSC